MRLSDAIDGYWLEKRRRLSPHTITDYDLTFRRFIAYTGDPDIAAVTSDQVRKFLDHLRTSRDLAPKTLANIWIALSSLWTWAQRELGIPHIIHERVERPRWRRPVIEPYTRIEIAAMLEACGHNAPYPTRAGRSAQGVRPSALRDRAIILTLLDTGLRASELCGLAVGDFDAKRSQLHIRHGKGDKARLVYLGDSTAKALWRYLADRKTKAAAAPLFTVSTERAFQRDNLRHMVQRCARRAGVLGCTLHRFRHTFAINFLRNGGNVLELQRLLGHEKMETIRIYAQLAEIDLAAAQKRASPADNWRL